MDIIGVGLGVCIERSKGLVWDLRFDGTYVRVD